MGSLEILHGDQGVDPAFMHAEGMGFQQTVVRQIGAQGGGCHVGQTRSQFNSSLFIPTSKCIYNNL